MRRIQIISAAFLVVTFASIEAAAPRSRSGGGWGAGGCPTSVEAKDNLGYEWLEFSDGDKDQIALYKGIKQVGVWSREHNYFRELKADGTFGPKVEKAPVDLPLKFKVSKVILE